MGMYIGVDIGWSTRAESCALVVGGGSTRPGFDFREYAGQAGAHPVWARRFQLAALVDFLNRWQPQLAEPFSAVLDGPMSSSGPPTKARGIDSSCRRGGFYGRCQPQDVHTTTGPTYVDATYQVYSALRDLAARCNLGTSFWPPGPEGAANGLCWVAETNPTVGLALLLPHGSVGPLPSRHRPVLLRGRRIRAKSDYYFLSGAGDWLETLLRADGIAAEGDHEIQAGLYCAAVARRLERQRSTGRGVAALGDRDGVYIVPEEVENSWKEHVEPMLYSGRLLTVSRQWTEAAPAASVARPAELTPRPARAGSATTRPIVRVGANVSLLLGDNGGVWERHNVWLEGFGAATTIDLLCPRLDQRIVLTRAGGAGQWRSAPTPLSLARQTGLVYPHLSVRAGHTAALSCEITRIV